MTTRKISEPSISKLAAGDPNKLFTVTTSQSRQMEYRELDALEEFRLNSLLGAKDAMNQLTSYQATIAVGVRRVDNVPFPFPSTEEAMWQAIARVGKDGFTAISDELIKRANVVDPEEELEAAGNSPANPV